MQLFPFNRQLVSFKVFEIVCAFNVVKMHFHSWNLYFFLLETYEVFHCGIKKHFPYLVIPCILGIVVNISKSTVLRLPSF